MHPLEILSWALNEKSSILDQSEASPHFDESSAGYIHSATSENTRKAYQSDIDHFLKWGGVLPTSPSQLIYYFTEQAPLKNPRTLKRRLIAIRKWHTFLQIKDDPTKDPSVLKILKGIERTHGIPKVQAAAMTLKDIDQIISYLNTQENNLLALRDKALLLVGYFGALRRSELVGLTWEQVRFEDKGIIIEVKRSKTDQIGQGESCIIPSGSKSRCPSQALLQWRYESNHYHGFIFSRFSGKGNLLKLGITGYHCNQIIKRLAKSASCDRAEDMSAHSLRRDFATESARLGASLLAIQKHGRWRCTRTVLEYIEAGRVFTDSAVNVLFGE